MKLLTFVCGVLLGTAGAAMAGYESPIREVTVGYPNGPFGGTIEFTTIDPLLGEKKLRRTYSNSLISWVADQGIVAWKAVINPSQVQGYTIGWAAYDPSSGTWKSVERNYTNQNSPYGWDWHVGELQVDEGMFSTTVSKVLRSYVGNMYGTYLEEEIVYSAYFPADSVYGRSARWDTQTSQYYGNDTLFTGHSWISSVVNSQGMLVIAAQYIPNSVQYNSTYINAKLVYPNFSANSLRTATINSIPAQLKVSAPGFSFTRTNSDPLNPSYSMSVDMSLSITDFTVHLSNSFVTYRRGVRNGQWGDYDSIPVADFSIVSKHSVSPGAVWFADTSFGGRSLNRVYGTTGSSSDRSNLRQLPPVGGIAVQQTSVTGANSAEITRNVTTGSITLPPPAASGGVNISTRSHAGSGPAVLILGFYITGGDRWVLVNARGPILGDYGLPNPVPDPSLEIHGPNGLVDANDNWQTHPNAPVITSTGKAPTYAAESSSLALLPPGGYTAVFNTKGNDGTGLLEAFCFSQSGVNFTNASTRGSVQSGNPVICSIIVGSGGATLVGRALGPTLGSYGITPALANPRIRLLNAATGQEIAANDDWQTNPGAPGTGLAPPNPLESLVVATVPAGAYSLVVEGVNNGAGIALGELFLQ